MLKMIFAALAGTIAASCAATTPVDGNAIERRGPPVITIRSNTDFNTTLANLKTAIDARSFKTFATIEHAKGAASIGLSLRPTTLVLFGNPKGGAPLMQVEQGMGLQLPLRMLVMEDAKGVVQLAYPDMPHIFREYGIADRKELLSKIEAALAAIAADAAASERARE